MGGFTDAADWGWAVHLEPLGFAVDGYWRSLCSWWAKCATSRSDLMVVEHDVVIHEGVFRQFNECREPVCAFSYWLGGDYDVGLGCVRFRGEFIRMHPDAVERAGRLVDDGLCVPGHWKRMDTRMWRVTEAPHRHDPPVKHLHDYPMKEPCESDWT